MGLDIQAPPGETGAVLEQEGVVMKAKIEQPFKIWWMKVGQYLPGAKQMKNIIEIAYSSGRLSGINEARKRMKEITK